MRFPPIWLVVVPLHIARLGVRRTPYPANRLTCTIAVYNTRQKGMDETMDTLLKVSSSPHLHSPVTTPRLMRDVLIALLPALVASVILFGPRALLLTAVCVASCVLAEFLCRKVMKRDNTIGDFSAAVTGVLLAFNLPASLPLWMAVIGCVVAIVVVKQCFGGLGQNFVNPAIAGRIVLMVSFPTQMTTWPTPFAYLDTARAATTATPLASLPAMLESGAADASALPSLADMLLGNRGGCLGEVCALALLLGGVYLIARRVISPIIPLCYIGTVALCMLPATGFDLTLTAYELLSGGLLLGAFFMATDYVTSPITTKGKVVFAIGCGLITTVIRLFASLPEGVSFSIMLMNILVPHIERLTAPKPFGTPKKKEAKA